MRSHRHTAVVSIGRSKCAIACMYYGRTNRGSTKHAHNLKKFEHLHTRRSEDHHRPNNKPYNHMQRKLNSTISNHHLQTFMNMTASIKREDDSLYESLNRATPTKMKISGQRVKNYASEIGPYDVLCGRCKDAFNNVGNRRFRVTINLNIPRYLAAKSRHEKSAVILAIVRMLRNDVGARFLKRKGKELIELDEKQARSKVGHALRDMSVAQQQVAEKASITSSCDEPMNPNADAEDADISVLDSSLDSIFALCGESDDDEPFEPIPAYGSPEYFNFHDPGMMKNDTPPRKKVHYQAMHKKDNPQEWDRIPNKG